MLPRLLPLAALTLAAVSHAEVTLAPLFRDGAVLQRDMPVPVWGVSTREGEMVSVSLDAGAPITTVARGGRWKVTLPPRRSGGVHTLTVAGDNRIVLKDIVYGEVWICSGQSNMEMTLDAAWPKHIDRWEEEIAAANLPKLRLFTVRKALAAEPQTNAGGSWTVCTSETARHFSAVAYFFGRDLQKRLGDVPVGLVSTSWGGTAAEAWTSRKTLETLDFMRPALAKLDEEKASYPERLKKFEAEKPELMKAHAEAVAKAKAGNKRPPAAPSAPQVPNTGVYSTLSGLHNAMLHPLIPYAFRGVIWYQGEANNARSEQYRTLFPAMIADWRKAWGRGDFPFLFVQIAPFNGMKPELREAQFLTLKKSPATAMVVTLDVGDATNIHPTNKAPVGARLALAARALAYGEKIEYSGPLFAGATFSGATAVVRFTHTGSGLVLKDGRSAGFELAGADGKFHPATAVVQGATLVVTASAVTEAKAVRYAWANSPECSLFNKEGLPASSFRSDAP